MGRGRGGKRKGGRGGGRGGGKWDEKRSSKWVTEEGMTNADFEGYYKALGIVAEDDWEAFMAALRRPLPLTFRINSSCRFASQISLRLENDFFGRLRGDDGQMIAVEGEILEAPAPLPWFPEKQAWRISCSRKQLRKHEALGEIFEFIKRENEFGSITRQEEVSMVPPFFMDINSDHNVLDLCASPGSKTFQLIEMLHAGMEPGHLPSGIVVANDIDTIRCNLLNHQTKRTLSPNVIISQHDAKNFPNVPSSTDPSGRVQFDRILCDVPCSGDGTFRKNLDIWRKWNTNLGIGLHWTQLLIGIRATKMLKVGGVMVYSTCSLNPIEDEAVVQAIVAGSGGAMELMDASAKLPELKRMPGIKSWKVLDKGEWFSNVEDVSAEQAAKRKNLRVSMFPLGTDVPLERCMRILPHQQDSGGFFVAVLRKVKDLPVSAYDKEMFPTIAQLRKQREQVGAKTDASGAPQNATDAKVDGAEENGCGSGVGKLGESEGKIDAKEEKIDVKEEKIDVKEEKIDAKEEKIDVKEEKIDVKEEKIDVKEEKIDVKEEKIDVKEEKMREEIPESIPRDAPASSPPEKRQDDQDPAAPVTSSAPTERAAQDSSPSPLHRAGRWKGIDPCNFISDPQLIADITDCYGIAPEFKAVTRLIVRTQDGGSNSRPKKIYSVSDSVSQILRDDCGEQLRVFATGVKQLERQDKKFSGDAQVKHANQQRLHCGYRVVQEGLALIMPYITKQVAKLTPEDFHHLIESRSVPIGKEGELHSGKNSFRDPSSVASVGALMCGSALIVLDTSTLVPGLGAEEAAILSTGTTAPAVVGWRGIQSLSIMMHKAEVLQMKEKMAEIVQLRLKAGLGEGPVQKPQYKRPREDQTDPSPVAPVVKAAKVE